MPTSPYDLPYQPCDPQKINPGIALVGCGDITRHHLQAYSSAGYRVLAFCDIDLQRAAEKRDKFYPDALVTDDLAVALATEGVEVVDIATHPPQRPPLIEAALQAGKHVLSQKPFVLDLDIGRRLADLAERQGVLLAVNQNARWSPHFSYLRQALAAGLLGTLHSVHIAYHWDHSWVHGTPFERVPSLIWYDYAIHWFDLIGHLMRDRPARQVFATTASTPSQPIEQALLGQAIIKFDDAQASLVLDGHSPCGAWGTYVATGSKGILRSEGHGDDGHQPVLLTDEGEWRPQLTGKWFDDGFHGAMGELLCAIEEDRQPTNSARQNLEGLALCFAAVESAATGKPVAPGSVTALPE